VNRNSNRPSPRLLDNGIRAVDPSATKPVDHDDRPVPLVIVERVHPLDDLVMQLDVSHRRQYRTNAMIAQQLSWNARYRSPVPNLLPVGLPALVAAIEQAHPHDETDWIEWKSQLNLSLTEHIVQVSRHILGMANRDTEVASRTAGGCGYVVVGIEPGSCQGIDPVDPATLEAQIRRFVGDSGPIWQALWVNHVGRHVLVVVVDAPQPGDPIHTLQRQFDKYDAGEIFVRRSGATHKAGPDDVRRLSMRLQAGTETDRLRVDLEVVDKSANLRVLPLDASATAISGWVERERARLLRELRPQPVDEGTAKVQGRGESGRSSIHAMLADLTSQSDAMKHAMGMQFEAEKRTPDQYREEVEAYLDAASAAIGRIAADALIESGLCQVDLAVNNPTDNPFRRVEVELSIPGEGLWTAANPTGSSLPASPRLWGDRWVNPIESFLRPSPFGAFDLGHIEDIGAWSIEIDNGGSSRLAFPPVDLAPRSSQLLSEFHVIAPVHLAGSSVECAWAARSTLTRGVAEGTIVMTIDDQPISCSSPDGGMGG
jgi:hypothetical protein